MIPDGRSYVEQLKLYERRTVAAGLHKLHGLRHVDAQARYEKLMGWAASAAGGKVNGPVVSRGEGAGLRDQNDNELGART